MGRIYDYKANYSHYLQLREDRNISHQIKDTRTAAIYNRQSNLYWSI